jgi:ankyrin repeat protein
MSRPGTAKSTRSVASGQFSGPSLLTDPALTLGNELENDSLLRILSSDQSLVTNAVVMLSEKGDARSLSKLIEKGVQISRCIGLDGFTPLHHAANRGHSNVVLVLIRAQHAIDQPNDAGETPLHLACYVGHLLIVEQLLDCGANINSRNRYGETPLFYATRRRMPLLVRLLLQRGADRGIQDDSGDVAADHTDDAKTLSMFSDRPGELAVPSRPQAAHLPHVILQRVYSYLLPREIGRCACVSGKWHRASENDELWAKFGKRRWEFALQASLGFAPTPSASFRPSSSKHSLARSER